MKDNDEVKEEIKDEVKDEFEEEYELEEKEPTSSDYARFKMFRFMKLVIIVVIILLVILFVASLFSTKKEYTYSDVESAMKKAAISYFKDHPDSLPLEEGSIVEIDASNLIAEERMKDFSEYVTDGNTCKGSVQVEKINADYLYTPYLTCGDNYITVELSKKIVSDNPVVTSGYGLYSTNGGYAFRGETTNNYVKMGEYLWRIVKITSNNNVVLISDEGMIYTQPWDNRYNQEYSYESGINQYSASRIREYLNKVYTNSSDKNNENILTESTKARIVSYDACVGKRNLNSESKDNSEECSEVLRNQKLGLLTLSDYLYASIDPNCKSATTKNCKNYNYLVAKEDWWLITANKDDTSTVFNVARNGNVVAELASNYAAVRPVIYLNSNVLYKSGNGTLDKPYTLR